MTTTTPTEITRPSWRMVEDDHDLAVEPLHLSVTATDKRTGATFRTHVFHDSDLSVQDRARRLLASTGSGYVVLAFDVDEDHDDVVWDGRSGADCWEQLTRAREVIHTALAAAARAR